MTFFDFVIINGNKFFKEGLFEKYGNKKVPISPFDHLLW